MRALLLVACAGLVACGAPDLSGIYQVTTHTEDQAGCGPGTPATSPPYFELKRGSLFGTTLFEYILCSAPQTSSCLDLGLLSIAFDVATRDGWVGDSYSANGSGSVCVLGHIASSALLQSDGDVRIEFRHFSQTFQSTPSGGCTQQAARAQSATLPCASDEVLFGTRV